MKKVIIALSGMPGSRKSLFAGELIRLGYQPIVLSQFVKLRLEEKRHPLIPSEYWHESLCIRQELGEDALAKLAWRQLSAKESFRVVVDGIRCMSEACYFQQRADIFFLVSVQAAPCVRHKRLLTSPHGFYAKEQRRMIELDVHELRLGVGSLIAVSDLIIFIDEAKSMRVETYLSEQAELVNRIVRAIESKDADQDKQTVSRAYLKTLSELLQA